MSRFPLPPDEPSWSEHWSTDGFREEHAAWCAESLGGPVRIELYKMRPWSAVWRVYDEDGGLFWAKENCPASRFEAGLLELLNRLTPERVVPVRAVDAESGRILLPDQGEVFGIEHSDVASWAGIVRQWGLLQRELLDHEPELSAVGVQPLALADAEPMTTERASALHALAASDLRRLGEEDYQRILECLPAVREAVEVVGALGLPAALNHNDLHGANVFVPRGAAMRFFDLGDALLTDPAAVLLVPLAHLEDRLGCAPDDPRLWAVAEAWIEVWDDLAPAPALRRALPHALRLARLGRHESWVRVSPGMTETESRDWASAGSEWLGTLPDPPLLAKPREPASG